MQNTAQFLEQKVLFHKSMNNKNTCEIVCKMQCLKNGLQFNVSNGSLSSTDPVSNDVF